MGGGGPIIILKKVAKDALSVGLNQSGSVKMWHVLLVTHAAAFVTGLIL